MAPLYRSLLHDVFQSLRRVGKALDGELLLIRDARSRNVVKQTPSSLPGPRLSSWLAVAESRNIRRTRRRGAYRWKGKADGSESPTALIRFSFCPRMTTFEGMSIFIKWKTDFD